MKGPIDWEFPGGRRVAANRKKSFTSPRQPVKPNWMLLSWIVIPTAQPHSRLGRGGWGRWAY
jgi:hypothetical protein